MLLLRVCQALVLAAANGCSLAVYTFTRGSTQPVGAQLHLSSAVGGSIGGVVSVMVCSL